MVYRYKSINVHYSLISPARQSLYNIGVGQVLINISICKYVFLYSLFYNLSKIQ